MEARGQVNCYEPFPYKKDGKRFYTINLAAGTTPFVKMFDGIHCQSICYHLRNPPAVTVGHAWYRPRPLYLENLDDESADHVLNGGLLCAELSVAIASQLPEDAVDPKWSYEQFQAFALKTYGRRLPPNPEYA